MAVGGTLHLHQNSPAQPKPTYPILVKSPRSHFSHLSPILILVPILIPKKHLIYRQTASPKAQLRIQIHPLASKAERDFDDSEDYRSYSCIHIIHQKP